MFDLKDLMSSLIVGTGKYPWANHYFVFRKISLSSEYKNHTYSIPFDFNEKRIVIISYVIVVLVTVILRS